MRKLNVVLTGMVVMALTDLLWTTSATAAPTHVAVAATHAAHPLLASNQGQVIASDGLQVRAIKVGQIPSTSLPPLRPTLAYHQIVTIRCYYIGQTITGPYGPTDVWDSIIGYQTNSHDGVASDAWIYTGSNTPNVPLCGGP